MTQKGRVGVSGGLTAGMASTRYVFDADLRRWRCIGATISRSSRAQISCQLPMDFGKKGVYIFYTHPVAPTPMFFAFGTTTLSVAMFPVGQAVGNQYPAFAQGQAMLKGIPSWPLSALHHNVAIDR